MERFTVQAARNPDAVGKAVTLQGWIRTRRDSKGGFSFLELNDGSCLSNIQIVADAKLANYESEIKQLSAGCSITVRGEVNASGGKEQATEIHAAEIIVHGWADPEAYPLQKKSAFVREAPRMGPPAAADQYVRRGRPRAKSDLSIDSRLLPGRRFPISAHADHYGQRLRRRRAKCSASRQSIRQSRRATTRAKSTIARTSFDRPAYLTVSGQLEGEIYATALGKIYTFGPTFRAENSNTTRHLAEFWMVEPEAAFFELEDNMALAERFLKRIGTRSIGQLPGRSAAICRTCRQNRYRAAESVVAKDFGASATPKPSKF